MKYKTLKSIFPKPPMHWVGDGFPVSSMFSYRTLGHAMNPFLLMDYAGPMEFKAGERHGVGEHPHRGFETVTLVLQGEVEHRDSSGAGGKIGPGDVQWMTAASGVVHEEMHSSDFAKRGGMIEMIQLWVNLPAQFKMSKPRYQALVAKDFPEVVLGKNGSKARVIAGTLNGVAGPAKTFSPVSLWNLQLKKGDAFDLGFPEGHSAGLFVFKGKIKINGDTSLDAINVAAFERNGNAMHVSVEEDASVLALGGEPILEPVVGHGPFVMNTEVEIMQAIEDYNQGRLGRLKR